MRPLTITFILILMLTPLDYLYAQALYVIAHKNSFSTQQDAQHIAEFYLLKIKTSSNGTNIIPINLPSDNNLRKDFSQAIFHRSPISLSEYWDRMSFRGISPPVIQKSEKAVVLFVKKIPGAIGYVNKIPAANTDILVLKKINE